MPTFTHEGEQARSRWLIDGSPDFGFIEASVIARLPKLPIWLKQGNLAFGYRHIEKNHGHWVYRHWQSVETMLYQKLGQSAWIYCTETDNKLKLSLRVNPSTLIVLEYKDNDQRGSHFSVTTAYTHPSKLDGQRLSRYLGRL
jgi:hypothetical protein